MANIKMNKKRYRGYTLKVSLGKDCYRHLTFPGSFTLEDLAGMILAAFDFDNDHLHAFFMDGKPYSDADCYYSLYSCEEGLSTNEIKVETLGLTEKRKFLFVFDFGDNWQFKCEVKKITDTPEKKPYISNIVGKAPEQYPNYDDEYDDDYDDDYDEEDAVSPYIQIEPELYKAAFDFKCAKPWKMLDKDDIFAVKFSDGAVGYVSVLGSRSAESGMILYFGDGGVSSLNAVLNKQKNKIPDKAELFEFNLKLDCIMAAFKCKSDIDPEFVSDIQSFAKENGISLRGKNSFPYFVRFLPQRGPWSVTNAKERKYIIRALDAAVELAKRLESSEKSEYRFGEKPIIPLITKKKSGYSLDSVMIPKSVAKKYQTLETTFQFKNFKSKADLECKIINFPVAAYNEIIGAPEYPVFALFIDVKRENVMFTDLFPTAKDVSVEMLDNFIAVLNKNKIFPRTIIVCDERTKAMLSDICERCGVELIVKESLPILGDQIDELVTHLFGCL